MKKSLLAAALMSCCAAAYADPSVQVYGLIDVGLSYIHSDADVSGVDSKDSFTMENAQEFGSRFGIRGSEDLGNGTKIGFVLESGIESDTGALDSKQGGRIFGRESTVTISGQYGALSVGHMPIFGSVLGANGLFRAIDPINANYTSAMGSGFASASMWTRVDNAVSYKTPTFAGLTGYAMYSFKNDALSKTDTGTEGKNDADRYASFALRYLQGPVEAIFVADTTMWGNGYDKVDANADDGLTLTVGGNYTFANQLKVIAFYQYFDSQYLNVNARGGVAKDGIVEFLGDVDFNFGSDKQTYGFVDGWGASIGVNYPVGNGIARAAFNYRDMENQDNVDFTRWTLAAAYDYSLSKRTTLYVMGGYSEEEVEYMGKSAKPSGCQISTGIIHTF